MKTRLFAIAASLLLLAGCATSRLDQLHDRAGHLEKTLKAEQQTALTIADKNRREERLEHLSTMRATLSAANVGLGTVRYMPEEDREMAYDVIDEVYGTIDWNIPLGPNEPQKPLPAKFNNGVLKLR